MRLGYVHFLATRRRCQRRTGSGLTSRRFLTAFGRSRINVARIARSAQSSRGVRCARRRTATSWPYTSSSAPLGALARVSNTSQPTIRTKIK